MKLYRTTYGQGPDLLILHGLLGSGGNWATLARKAYGPQFRTIVPDLRNHGRSPHDPVFSYEAMVADLLELMEDEGIEKAHVLGHSMGGKLAMHLALEHPERVGKLIIADIGPQAYRESHGPIFDIFEAVDPSKYDSRKDIDEAMSAVVPEFGLRQFLLKNLERNGDSYRWGMNLPAIRNGYSELVREVESWEPFDGDVRFVRGGKSRYLKEEDIGSIRALFPLADMVTMEESGHWLHADNPELFAELTLSFLSHD